MKSIRIRGIILTCATCEHETEATAVLGLAFRSTPFAPGSYRVDASGLEYTSVVFPRAAITGSESEWRFDERAQVAMCPECAPKEPA